MIFIRGPSGVPGTCLNTDGDVFKHGLPFPQNPEDLLFGALYCKDIGGHRYPGPPGSKKMRETWGWRGPSPPFLAAWERPFPHRRGETPWHCSSPRAFLGVLEPHPPCCGKPEGRVVPFSWWYSLIWERMLSRPLGSRPAVGSSSTKTLGCMASTPAMATRAPAGELKGDFSSCMGLSPQSGPLP